MSTKLSIDNLHVSYGSRDVLKGVDLPQLSGVVGLLGPNASGKSTMIKSIAGVHRPRTGRIVATTDGRDITGRTLHRSLGYVPQDLPATASLTAFETVLIAARRQCEGDPTQATADVFMRLNLAHIAQRYLGELSGGQRQLIAAAQMLVTTPDVMLLDEPTSALDLHHQLFLLEIVREEVAQRGAVALIAIHDVNVAARYCDHLAVLCDGVVYASGSPVDVVTSEMVSAVYHVDVEVVQHRGIPLINPVRQNR